MEVMPIDWEKIFEDEDPNRTAVIVTQSILNNSMFRVTVDSEHYGTIETTRYGHTDGKSFLVIQFKDATSARNLIAKRYIAMWETSFTVIPFRSHDKLIQTIRGMSFSHSPYYTPIAPETSDDNILNVLNDDCLGEVFKRMNPWDRIRMENVCSRFKRVAKKAFVSVYRNNNIWLSHLNPNGNLIDENACVSVYKKIDIWRGQLNPDKNLTLTEIEKFLRRYGPSINWMTLYDSDYKHIADGLNSILKLMAKYCPNIKKLRLISIYFEDEVGVDTQTMTEIRPLLSKLSDFTIGFRPLSICNEFIEACDEIERLHLMFSEIDSVLSEIAFPKLKSCRFTDITVNGVIDGFLTQNPQIESLNIPDVTGVIHSIPDKVPNLRELHIRSCKPLSIDESLCLKSLVKANISIESIYLNMITGDSRENLLKITNITSLTVVLKNVDSLDELTKNLWKLEKLDIRLSSHYRSHQKMSMNLIKEMCRHANKLTHLEISGFKGIQFREQDYNDILHIVKNRNNRIGLNIKITSSCGQLKNRGMKTFILNTDPRWLTIVSCFINRTQNHNLNFRIFIGLSLLFIGGLLFYIERLTEMLYGEFTQAK